VLEQARWSRPPCPAQERPGAQARVRVDLGPVTVALGCANTDWCRWIELRFGPFLSRNEPAWTVLFEADRATPDWLASPLERFDEPLRTETTACGFELRGATFAATVDRAHRRAHLAGPLALYPLDGLLRHLLPVILADGLVLHAALLIDGDRAWVCSGPSGSGKSTLASLLPELACSDELVYLAPAKGRWQATALPFWQARPARAELTGIFLLEHAPSHRRSAIEPGQALQALTSQVLWPTVVPELAAASFERLCTLVREVPSARLGFTPDRGVIETLRGSVAARG
jgi:hypothetical protein